MARTIVIAELGLNAIQRNPLSKVDGAFRRHALATCKPQSPGEHFREARSGKGAGLAGFVASSVTELSRFQRYVFSACAAR